MSHDWLSFFLAWVTAPRRVGAIAPSSAALARLITREISPESAPVLELGPGTGVFTYELLKRGLRQNDLTLVESGVDFIGLLQMRFPGARVLWMDAARIGSDKVLADTQFGAVVSGLPLLTMPPRKVIAILTGAFARLRPGGAFYQFTYGPTCPVPRPILERLGLRARRVDRLLRNVPPATVYRLTRRSPLRLHASAAQTEAPLLCEDPVVPQRQTSRDCTTAA
jgi:phosphatidylethanolamine/phosphatidyl-N-methylethanolamine N-methyltransferase